MPETSFTDLPDLASESLGGWAMWANDEFFAARENLTKPHAAEWREHEYTAQGKWMDGWETRRRREPGSDICIIRLGLPGTISGVVVDTAFFRGNFPAECQLEGARIVTHYDLRAIHDPATEWKPIVPRSPLQGDSKNAFAVESAEQFTHVKLTIFPDGGVARLRIHGQPGGELWRRRDLGGPVDLAALENGARSLGCSDMFFGSRHHLILPGKPLTMGGGWETRRRRGPGHDWNIVALAATGRLLRAEVDTMHFKGNAPGRASIEACSFPGDPSLEGLLQSADWRELLPEAPLQPHTRHVFDDELRVLGPVSHVRLNVFPDGGVARLRLWGEHEHGSAQRARLSIFDDDAEAERLLSACCGSRAWVQAMLARRPFTDPQSLLRQAESAWFALAEADWLQAFAAHPRIGERHVPQGQPKEHAAWAEKEQSGAQSAAADTREALAQGNRAYQEKFGFVYLVCATGKSAEALLAILPTRLGKTRQQELRTAAEEQAKITALRLRKILEAR